MRSEEGKHPGGSLKGSVTPFNKISGLIQHIPLWGLTGDGRTLLRGVHCSKGGKVVCRFRLAMALGRYDGRATIMDSRTFGKIKGETKSPSKKGVRW